MTCTVAGHLRGSAALPAAGGGALCRGSCPCIISHIPYGTLCYFATDLEMFLSINYWLPVLTSGKNEVGSIPASRGAGGVISNKKAKITNSQNGKTDSNRCEMQEIDLGRKRSELKKKYLWSEGARKQQRGVLSVGALKEERKGELGLMAQSCADMERQRLVRVSYGVRPARRSGTKCFGCLLPALSISASSEMTKKPQKTKEHFLFPPPVGGKESLL